jgi:hypothetical protein
MPLRSRLTERFGIERPIISAPMARSLGGGWPLQYRMRAHLV